MMSKAFLYDWNGANVAIFKAINGIHLGEMYDTVMILLSQIADRHNFPYYLMGLAAYVVLWFLASKIMGRGGVQHSLSMWLGVFLVLVGGYAADGVVIGQMKKEFSYPRPYIALASDEVRVLEHGAASLAPRPPGDPL